MRVRLQRSGMSPDARELVIATLNVADRTNVVCCMSVRSSVVAAEALALLFSCSFWPSAAGSSFENSALTKSEEHTMQATVRRNQGVVGKRTDGLSRETGQANQLAAAWLRGSGRGECR